VAVTPLLRDMGFTPHGEGPHRFEVNGTNVAHAFLSNALGPRGTRICSA